MMRSVLGDGLRVKWRLFVLGARWSDKRLLLKYSLRHHLKKIGIAWEWSGREAEVTLKLGARRWTLRCQDDPGHLAALREIFGEEQYRLPDELRQLGEVVDLGANIGGFAAYIGLRFPEARLHCVEADRVNFGFLEQNLRRNSPAATALCRAAVGAGVKGPVAFYRASSPASHSLQAPAEGGGDRVEVESIGLEQLLQGMDRIDLLKCDIEGAESDVLGSMPEAVARRIGWIVVEYHSQAIRQGLLTSLGAHFTVHGELPIDASNGLLWLRGRSFQA